MSQVAHQAGHYVGFCSMKRLGVLQPPSLDGMLIHCKVPHTPPPPQTFHQASLTIRQYPFILLAEK